MTKAVEMTLKSNTKRQLYRMVFTPLSTVFQSYNSDSSYYSCLSWVSPVLGWGPEVLPKDTHTKNPEDPVLLEPRTPGLQDKHFTTEPRRTPQRDKPSSLSLLYSLSKEVLLCYEEAFTTGTSKWRSVLHHISKFKTPLTHFSVCEINFVASVSTPNILNLLPDQKNVGLVQI